MTFSIFTIQYARKVVCSAVTMPKDDNLVPFMSLAHYTIFFAIVLSFTCCFFVLYVTNDDGTDDDGGDRNCIDEENYHGNLFIAYNLCDSCASDGQDTLTQMNR